MMVQLHHSVRSNIATLVWVDMLRRLLASGASAETISKQTMSAGRLVAGRINNAAVQDAQITEGTTEGKIPVQSNIAIAD